MKKLITVLGILFLCTVVKAQDIPIERKNGPTTTTPVKIRRKPVAVVKTPVPGDQTASVKIISDADCTIYIDGKSKGEFTAGEPLIVSLPKGNYLVKAVGVKRSDVFAEVDTVKTTDTTLFYIGLRAVIAARIEKEKQDEQARIAARIEKQKQYEEQVRAAAAAEKLKKDQEQAKVAARIEKEKKDEQARVAARIAKQKQEEEQAKAAAAAAKAKKDEDARLAAAALEKIAEQKRIKAQKQKTLDSIKNVENQKRLRDEQERQAALIEKQKQDELARVAAAEKIKKEKEQAIIDARLEKERQEAERAKAAAAAEKAKKEEEERAAAAAAAKIAEQKRIEAEKQRRADSIKIAENQKRIRDEEARKIADKKEAASRLVKYATDNSLVLIKSGSFKMGGGYKIGDIKISNNLKIGVTHEGIDSKVVHDVSLGTFYICTHEVTQAQWKEIMGNNPSKFQGCEFCPVENVSWNDAQDYIKKLNEQEDVKKLTQKTGYHYRLPTEAEWEYAARGGAKSENHTYSGSKSAYDVAWFFDVSGGKTHQIGGRLSNELGLVDMSGNVWEWCEDWYDEDYYSKSAAHDPQGPPTGTSRVYRGGSYLDKAAPFCQVAIRASNIPGFRDSSVGFRVVLAP